MTANSFGRLPVVPSPASAKPVSWIKILFQIWVLTILAIFPLGYFFGDVKNACTFTNAQYTAQHAVEAQLDYPYEASFVYSARDVQYVYKANKCKFTINGHVDAKTAGGFKRRVGWTAEVHLPETDGAKPEVTATIFN